MVEKTEGLIHFIYAADSSTFFGFYVHVIDLYNFVQSRWATAHDHLQTI